MLQRLIKISSYGVTARLDLRGGSHGEARACLQVCNLSTEFVELGLVGRLKDSRNAVGVPDEGFREAFIIGVFCCMIERTSASWVHSLNGYHKAAIRSRVPEVEWKAVLAQMAKGNHKRAQVG
jgi:hypothetical protein